MSMHNSYDPVICSGLTKDDLTTQVVDPVSHGQHLSATYVGNMLPTGVANKCWPSVLADYRSIAKRSMLTKTVQKLWKKIHSQTKGGGGISPPPPWKIHWITDRWMLYHLVRLFRFHEPVEISAADFAVEKIWKLALSVLLSEWWVIQFHAPLCLRPGIGCCSRRCVKHCYYYWTSFMSPVADTFWCTKIKWRLKC